MVVTFRPLSSWPGQATPDSARRAAQFSAGYEDTLYLLEREVERLGADRMVIELALGESDIRLDGWPRARTVPLHPGVVVSFESRHGAQRYPTDAFTRWHDNLRAIALSLESLRRVDRYGVSRHGEQYRGWRALGAGGPSIEHGLALIDRLGGPAEALRATHPDTRAGGYTDDDFHAVMAAHEAARA